jgi:hypothetical protein
LRERQYVLHDDALGHSAMTVKYFLVNQGIVEMSHPPYSTDLPADCFLFPEWKKKIEDVVDNKENITAKLNAVPLDAFDYSFMQILSRSEKCVAVRHITLERK